MIRSAIVIATGLALAATLPIAPAQAAGVARTFLSAAGSDSNNCANVLTPCRHLAAAYANTAPDGEIYVLDPANYGSLTITHGVSIEGHGWASIAPVSGQAAITINALGATDKINIIGVVLDGTALPNTTGIQFNSGGTLTVRDSVIRNFSGDGIDFEPTAAGNLFVSNTMVSDNANTGIAVFPSGNNNTAAHTVIFNRVETNNNSNYGVFLWGTPSTGSITAIASESTASGNGIYGFYVLTDASHSPTSLMLFHSVAAGNNTGLFADGTGASIIAAQTVFTGAGLFAWNNDNGATPTTFGDNYLPPGFAGVGGNFFTSPKF
jgi:hypothetical protein